MMNLSRMLVAIDKKYEKLKEAQFDGGKPQRKI